MRYKDRLDLVMFEFSPNTVVSGVMTQSTIVGAPIDWNKRILRNKKARALIVNAGIANVFTGKKGQESVKKIAFKVSEEISCPSEQVYISSTGTIGETLEEKVIIDKINHLKGTLAPEAWENAAKAIMTTDTFPKGAHRLTKIEEIDVNIVGIAKGSGMIAPNMATMLAFIFTDANLNQDILQKLLSDGNEKSFNSITVDSDTSTSDMVLMFSTGHANHSKVINASDSKLKLFSSALNELLTDLAKQIVKDGEGATKLIEINVSGAKSNNSARKIGLAIGNSPLVKTAISGEDANWGRIIMAIGKSGEKINPKNITLSIGKNKVAEMGERIKNYDEKVISKNMKEKEIVIDIELSEGRGFATIWTCDLSHRYIDINADYRS